MQSVKKRLKADCKSMPNWLTTAESRCNFESLGNFFSSRVVYYPGAGQDGRAFELFGGTHSAHCFLHIDWTNSGEEVLDVLNSNGATSIRGYRVGFCELNSQALQTHRTLRVKSALWAILDRTSGYSEVHGPKRLAFLHVQAEAVQFCSHVWRQLDANPFAVVLQDHGWGGINGQTKFGEGRQLPEVARTSSLAKYLLVAENTVPWGDYEPVSRLTTHQYGQDRQRGGSGHRVQLFTRRQDLIP
jgi:hypothetical protein